MSKTNNYVVFYANILHLTMRPSNRPFSSKFSSTNFCDLEFKFSSFVCSFPITIVNENSFLSRKFYKDFKQPIKEELFQYEKFCQTEDNSISAKRKEKSSPFTNEKAKNGNNFSFYISIYNYPHRN